MFCFFLFQIDEILDAAEKLKGIGNEQFKTQNYKVAEKKYTKTLRSDKININLHANSLVLPLFLVYDCNLKQRNINIKLVRGLENN